MEKKEIRVRLHAVLHKRMRIVCANADLSMNKQIVELIRKFVEVHEENLKFMQGE
jgi:septum formation topological specificity factor MinE